MRAEAWAAWTDLLETDLEMDVGEAAYWRGVEFIQPCPQDQAVMLQGILPKSHAQ